MANEDASVEKGESEVKLEGGTYEIIRNRLVNQGKELTSRLEQLNQARKNIFGSIEPTLLATERITTANNCTPRDMVPVNGRHFIFGYNVQMGLRTGIKLSDVFSIYAYQDRAFQEKPLDILNSERFESDFQELYKYYKETTFAKFSIIGPHLFMVFRVGKSLKDIKTFKWAIDDQQLTYVGNRSDHEFKYPPQLEFTWVRTNRDQHRGGMHPHISLADRVFVEAVGGDITFKMEDNTESGQGIYAEPVENKDQTLDDADIRYAFVGNLILVRIRPYQEEATRYFVFNEKTRQVHRVDAIEQACVLLPDDQGLIFPNGYYLQTGELKQFESSVSDMIFERRLASANGEDYMYVFYNRETGNHILLSYNVIGQKVDNPVLCSGFSCFDNGEMLIFRSDEEPVRHHVIQVWQTPFVSGEHAFSEKHDSFLYKVGNQDIVRCMAECHELLRLINKEDTYSGLYIDLVKKATDVNDAYFWIDREESFNLKESLVRIKETANGAIDEFEKVVRLKKHTKQEADRVSAKTREILRHINPEYMTHIDHFVKSLADLRSVRGEIISLKDLRYVDLAMVESLETEVTGITDKLSGLCVEFLLDPKALGPYEARVTEIGGKIDGLERVADAKAVGQEVGSAGTELEMLIEIVSNLKIEDSTQTTRIIDNISAIYATLNQVKASLRNKAKGLQSAEGVAEFNAQIKLLNQSVINYLDICETPEKCDEYLTKVMVQIEELEGRFVDFDDFVIQLTEKRDELYNAFESRKLTLVEARNKRANALMSAAERILKGIRNRVDGMDDINIINGYFASDLMIDKIRDIIRQLTDIDDSVKADDIQSRLKTIREDAVRQLKDRKELFVDGANVIKFGKHKFSVNVQPLDLTVVMRDGEQMFHLTGTNFFEPIRDEAFLETRPVWNMEVVSENTDVYRAEFLAYLLLADTEAKMEEKAETEAGSQHVLEFDDAQLLEHVRKFMGSRYTEGYSKGVHDADGAKLFKALVKIHLSIGLLRFHPRVRGLARLFWETWSDAKAKKRIEAKLSSFGMVNALFPNQEKQDRYIGELETLIASFVKETGLFQTDLLSSLALDSATYLFFELVAGGNFVISKEAQGVVSGFNRHLKSALYEMKFKEARDKVSDSPAAEFELVRDWVRGYLSTPDMEEQRDYLDEATALLFNKQSNIRMNVVDIQMTADIDGMRGDHKVIREGVYHLNYYSFMEKLGRFKNETVPAFNRYHNLKKELTDKMSEGMRLDEFKPRVLTSFVRNRLINKVYLPIIGDNLAKQIGVVGEDKRTDLMGLLLLVSPPGYGKTTLMEYIANRLGVIFMKINGPAIGNQVTSLDPAEAPFASAREEIQKLNLSLEMGDNVMIYLDDIQHCNPELLQKFISLCDAQRKIEGVYKGKTRTYDLRGKKVAVVMAGNPYTESGEKFKIPDMLANRADTYNLGDIIGDTLDDFESSYLENALTSNAVLNNLASRSQEDVYSIIQIARTGDREGVELKGTYSVEEVNEMVSVMKKMIRVQDTILKVNQEYIRSAAQADEYRTEPAFKLQGSYRNMNRITEKIVPIMNDNELKTLLMSHYENEAQTLTTATEANLLKFREMTGWMTEEDEDRWNEIKRSFNRRQLVQGAETGDPVGRVVVQLSAFQEGLGAIKDILAKGMDRMGKRRAEEEESKLRTELDRIEAALREMEHAKAAQTEQATAVRPADTGPTETRVTFSDETLERLEKLLGEIKAIPVATQVIQAMPADSVIMPPPQTIIQTATAPASVQVPWPGVAETPPEKKIVKPPPLVPDTLRAIHKMPKNYFYLMIKKGELKGVEALLDRGKDINARTAEGATPIMAAAVHGHHDVVKLLCDRGADIDAVDKDGYTALMVAASKGRSKVVKVLLANNANTDILDQNGMTALMWAEKNGHEDVVRLLKGKPN